MYTFLSSMTLFTSADDALTAPQDDEDAKVEAIYNL